MRERDLDGVGADPTDLQFRVEVAAHFRMHSNNYAVKCMCDCTLVSASSRNSEQCRRSGRVLIEVVRVADRYVYAIGQQESARPLPLLPYPENIRR